MDWISINDSLPPDESFVLTYRPGSVEPEMVIEKYMDGWWTGDTPYREAVTHWMPLPAAPGEIGWYEVVNHYGREKK